MNREQFEKQYKEKESLKNLVDKSFYTSIVALSLSVVNLLLGILEYYSLWPFNK